MMQKKGTAHMLNIETISCAKDEGTSLKQQILNTKRAVL